MIPEPPGESRPDDDQGHASVVLRDSPSEWTLVSGDSSILLPVVLISMGALYYSRGKALQAFEYIEKKWRDGEGLSR